ncbi:MAG: choice-of-anchor D domain-containing protein [Ignavibacteria bacterium]|nr:choice-of-anchor D domain-containing protein [Ignavibacteria bacterium]
MKKLITALFYFLTIASSAYSQTLLESFPFPNYSQYNSFWGIVKLNDTLRIATDNNGSIYKVTDSGIILDSMTTPFTFNHGLIWDGSGYWIAEDFRTAGARLFKINSSGVRTDSILLPSLTGGATGGVGDIALDGDGIWFSVYSPDFTAYPYAYAYKINLATRLITDTIPLRGRQVQGITVKGDTVIYVNDYFHTTPFVDTERIYAYRKSTGDTLFSFPTPDPDGDCNPRGLYWDGRFLWMIADRIGNNVNLYRTLYKYSLSGLGNPQITTSTNSIDFGNTIIGTTADRNLNISNTGTAKLIISNYNITNPRFSILPNSVPDTINPGQNKNYTVKFTPSVFDTTSGQLRISSNDGGTPVKIISLRGKGVYNGSFISSNTTYITYFGRRVNCLSGGYVDITNQGSSVLSVNSITFNTQRFRLDTTGLTFPVLIDTQKTKQFRIWFNPLGVTSYADTARINSDALNIPQLKIALLGTATDINTILGEIYWQGNIPDNPNTTSDNLKVMSMKEIPDVNYDGKNDVIVSTDNYWTICYNGNSSVTDDILWKFNTRQSSNVSGSVVYEDGMQILDDINSDGIRDVVIGTGGNNELVYALSGRTGQLLWTYGDSSLTSDGDINGLSVNKDFNNDGKNDILAAATGEGMGAGRHAVICLNSLNGSVIFYSVQNGEFTHSTASTSSGGAIDYSSNGGPYGINGFSNSGSQIWTQSVSSTVWNLKEIQDVNTDGETDLASFIGFSGTLRIFSGSNGVQLSTQDLGSSIDGNIRLMQDISADGFKDIVSSGPRTLYRIDSRSAVTKWSNPLDNNYIHCVDELSDINGDSIKEVVTGTQNSNLYVLDGNNGMILYTYNFGSVTVNTVEQVCKLSSIDFNSKSEFLGGSRAGKVICFSGGQLGVIGINSVSNAIPGKFNLYQNYPNPFNPVTKIKFDVPEVSGKALSNVRIIIYDALGRIVNELVNEKLNPGSYETELNGNNLSSGVYFYKLESGDFSIVKKMMLMK